MTPDRENTELDSVESAELDLDDSQRLLNVQSRTEAVVYKYKHLVEITSLSMYVCWIVLPELPVNSVRVLFVCPI